MNLTTPNDMCVAIQVFCGDERASMVSYPAVFARIAALDTARVDHAVKTFRDRSYTAWNDAVEREDTPSVHECYAALQQAQHARHDGERKVLLSRALMLSCAHSAQPFVLHAEPDAEDVCGNYLTNGRTFLTLLIRSASVLHPVASPTLAQRIRNDVSAIPITTGEVSSAVLNHSAFDVYRKQRDTALRDLGRYLASH